MTCEREPWIAALERLHEAVTDYVGARPLELLKARDEGDSLIGATADPKWVRLLEALRDANANSQEQP